MSLAERRRQQKLISMYKSVSDFVPTCVSELIPPTVGEISTYTLRNQHDITVPFCMTKSLRKSLRKHAYLNLLKILQPKKENFPIKKSDIFHISSQNINYGYLLGPPRLGGSNE